MSSEDKAGVRKSWREKGLVRIEAPGWATQQHQAELAPQTSDFLKYFYQHGKDDLLL